MIVRLLLLIVLLLGSRVTWCEQLFITSHPAMGTEYTLYLYAKDGPAAKAVSDEVFDEIDRIDDLLSNYKPTSELSRVNRDAAKLPVQVEPEVFAFLQESQHWSEVSEGGFDMTVGPLMRLWGFYQHAGKIATAEELKQAAVGYKHVHLDATAKTVSFDEPGIELDPGGIGKGYAVDSAVRLMKADGVKAAMLSAGGSTVYALGAPPSERGWKVLVRGPLPSEQVLSTLYLRDTSYSSADCTKKNFIKDGHVYCHILDPRTRTPVADRVQVGVIHPSATASDALSNVVFVANAETAAAQLKSSAPTARALMITQSGSGAKCTTFRWTAVVSGLECAIR